MSTQPNRCFAEVVFASVEPVGQLSKLWRIQVGRHACRFRPEVPVQHVRHHQTAQDQRVISKPAWFVKRINLTDELLIEADPVVAPDFISGSKY